MMKRFLLTAMFLLCIAPTAGANGISQEVREQVTAAVIRHLMSEYVDPEEGRLAAKALKSALETDELRELDDGQAFAEALSRILQQHTGDGHLNVQYSEKPIDLEKPVDEAFSEQEMVRR